jgi:hypothetical protein
MAAGEIMLVNGCDCSIVIKTAYREVDVPYAGETLREAVSLLQEEASIEGDGVCRAVRKCSGITGCVVTPLTMGSAPLLLYLAMGGSGLPVFVSETRGVYQCDLSLLPLEDSGGCDLIQDRGGARKLFEGCRVKGFELRFLRGEAVHLKLDVCGGLPPAVYPYADQVLTERGERFSGDGVGYRINGAEYKNIYGVTLAAKKEGGTKTEIWIKRSWEQGGDLPALIEEMTMSAQLLRDVYEDRRYGLFRITATRLVLVSDETEIDCADAVIGPLRYYVAGTVNAAVFTSGEENEIL